MIKYNCGLEWFANKSIFISGGTKMKKIILLLFIFALAGSVLVTCSNSEVVSYCPFCSKSNIKEISIYDPVTGKTEVYYECQNAKCQKKFGAGQLHKN